MDNLEKINFKDLPQEEKAAVIAKDAVGYSVICRCVRPSPKGRLWHSIPHPPKTIDG